MISFLFLYILPKLQNAWAFLLSKIRESKLSDPLKSQILTQIDYITFKGLSVLRLRIPAQSELSSIDDEFYIRENSSTVKIDGTKLIAASKIFN